MTFTKQKLVGWLYFKFIRLLKCVKVL